jgi:hypothetical protein
LNSRLVAERVERYDYPVTVLKAHFDGKVLVPDEPVDLPVDCALEVHVLEFNANPPIPSERRPLLKFLQVLESLPDDPNSPIDGASQHDHYLYGVPKRS